MSSNKQAINLTSLSLIQEELMVTIDEASKHLETFVSERDNLKSLDDCIASLQQIRGSLDVIQLHGACELAGEILSTAVAIKGDANIAVENKLTALTKGFFVLSCYFEYTQQHEMGMPVLLVPYINDIRLANREVLIPESYFEQGSGEYRKANHSSDQAASAIEDVSSMVRRFRHMFQIGLLGVVKEVRIEQSLQLMQRACDKMRRMTQGTSQQTLWWLAVHCIESFIVSNISPTVTRKRLFTSLDKEFKRTVKEGSNVFSQASSDELLRELAYYISLGNLENAEHQEIKQLFAFDHLGYTTAILQDETVALTGPSANTVQSVAEVLRVELNMAKENMEWAESASEEDDNRYPDTLSRIQKVKDILQVVGLVSASNVLSSPLDVLEKAINDDVFLSEEDRLDTVNAFLYVESVLNSLDKRNFSGEKLAEINRLTQNEMISNNNLQQAQLVVIEQAEHGLSSIKQALTLFADSSYDNTHLNEITQQLHEIRGAMIVLSLERAAAVIVSATAFIEKALIETHETAALPHMLETFADALICLEYYLDCMKVDQHISADTLAIAEESLAALGYPV